MRNEAPLQNRVLPTGEIVAIKERGLLMGNRGGRFHDPMTRTLRQTRRPTQWSTKRWISCLTAFKDRKRIVMGHSYTELFFLDEVTALAAGHRPCFECRREAAVLFLDALHKAGVHQNTARQALRVDDVDALLHGERTQSQQHPLPCPWQNLPDGAMVQSAKRFYAVRNCVLYEWRPAGYQATDAALINQSAMSLLTPPSIVKALDAGYAPVWHNSCAT
ncbi:MAG: hypothetical protein HWE23_05555 [Rhodobacteraceae bacterium]|nr:hypothetical protein [Paracoccaceae bacterium]